MEPEGRPPPCGFSAQQQSRMASTPNVPDVVSPPLAPALAATASTDPRLKDVDPEALAALDFYKQKDTSKGTSLTRFKRFTAPS